MSKFYNLLGNMVDEINISVKNTTLIEDLHIESTNDVVSLSLRGVGTVKVLTPYEYKLVDLTEELQQVEIKNTNGNIYIQNISGVTEIDAHGQNITSFIINSECPINKLVIYDNEINKLNLFNCKQLQFLHMHNNPICDDDNYANNLAFCMSSLPDRCVTSTGSIILYPWYGLEVLICKDLQDSSKYIKYPSGYSELVPENGRLYGIVDGDNITYCVYEGGEYKEYSEMNRHHRLRKRLESDICLKKNWIFGSAIMYDEKAWSRCPWDFREGHVADMWETAEKGFGLTYGGFDKFTNTLAGFRHFNIKDFRCVLDDNYELVEIPQLSTNYKEPSEDDREKRCYKEFLDREWDHGDSFLSILAGNGEEDNGVQRFGYIPNCKYVLVDQSTENGNAALVYHFPQLMNWLTDKNIGCDAISLSTNLPSIPPNHDHMLTSIGVFGEDNIFTISAGNTGDGLPYTSDISGNIARTIGDYTVTDDNGNSTVKHSSALVITASTIDRRHATYSRTSVDASSIEGTREDYFAYFGEQLPAFGNIRRTLRSFTGTSGASPACCGILLLMKNIYRKMFPTETSFGKYSNFMNHVRTRWCDHMHNQMDTAIGFGMPYILAQPYAPRLLESEPQIKFQPSVELGNPLDVTYLIDRYAKQSFTPEQRYSSIAISRSGDIYPLFPAQPLNLKFYSNSSQKYPLDYNSNYYTADISVTVLDNNVSEVPGSLPISETKLTTDNLDEAVITVKDSSIEDKEFTVQFALDFTDKLYPADVGSYTTKRDLLYFTDSGYDAYVALSQIKYNYGDTYVNLSNAAITQKYFNEVSERLEYTTVARKMGVHLDLSVTPYAIITMTFSKKGIVYFLNGTVVGHTSNYPELNVKLSDVYVNRDSLCHNTTGCVRMYNRILTDEEIIQNTIYLLNCHFEEE